MLMSVMGALALACFVKVCGVVFLGAPRSAQASTACESGLLMRIPMLILATACVVIGLLPAFFWPVVGGVAGAWRPEWQMTGTPLAVWTLTRWNLAFAALAVLGVWILWRRIRANGFCRAVTWDCGYAFPTARMQYTAGSFAGIITEWFQWILCTRRHEERVRDYFPQNAALTEHTPETVLTKVVEPVGAAVMEVSSTVRRLQHGRIQAYVLYLVVGLVGLALLVFLGGAE
jgi:hydrogenase-4 component B